MALAFERSDDHENVNEWIRFGMKLGIQSLLHPFEYSKVLIQVRKKFMKRTFVYLFSVSDCEVLNLLFKLMQLSTMK